MRGKWEHIHRLDLCVVGSELGHDHRVDHVMTRLCSGVSTITGQQFTIITKQQQFTIIKDQKQVTINSPSSRQGGGQRQYAIIMSQSVIMCSPILPL